jgi:hypothetical protein
MAITSGLAALARQDEAPVAAITLYQRAGSGHDDGCRIIGGALTPGQAGSCEPPGPHGAIGVCVTAGDAVFCGRRHCRTSDYSHVTGRAMFFGGSGRTTGMTGRNTR